MLNTSITDKDLNFIDEILIKYATDTSIKNVSELDGFLTSIASGPDAIMFSEWLPCIWGGEAQSPEWESEQEISRFMQTAIGMMNGHIHALMNRPHEFKARFSTDKNKGSKEAKFLVDSWCNGYMRAVLMRPQSWKNMPDEIEVHLGTITMFGTQAGEKALQELPDDMREEFSKEVEPAARALHAYWLKQRAHLAHNQPPPVRSNKPFVRTRAKISPNEACPCNSGKKYKKCCGAH